jgi:hypothetical protein
MYLDGVFHGTRFIENNTFLEVVDEDIVFKRRRNSAPDLIWRYDFSPPRECNKSRICRGTTATSEESDDKRVVVKDVCVVAIKNIPCSCKRGDIVEVIESSGFMTLCSFFYLPTRSGKILGYGFVGFPYPLLAEAFAKCFHGFQFPRKKSQKVLKILPASIQGLDANWCHFKKNGVMDTQSLFCKSERFKHYASACHWQD